MSEPDWGLKRICQSCGVKFYDFHKASIICPSCGAAYDPEAVAWGRKAESDAAPDKDKDALSKFSEESSDEVDLVDDIALEEEVNINNDDDTLLEEDDDDTVDNQHLGVETFSDDDEQESV